MILVTNSDEEQIKAGLLERHAVEFAEIYTSYLWEQGIQSITAYYLAHVLRELDYQVGGDELGLEFGGDGDNGEQLIYLLTIAEMAGWQLIPPENHNA